MITSFGVAFCVFYTLLVFFGGGNLYDPDPSAEFRYKQYQKERRKIFLNKIKNKLFGNH